MFETTPGPTHDLSLDHQRGEGRAVAQGGEQKIEKSFFLCIDSPLVAWEKQVGIFWAAQKTWGSTASFWRTIMIL